VTAVADPARQSAESFARGSHRLLIGGEWVQAASGQTFETVNPANEDVLGRVARGQAEDIDRAVGAARRAFADDSPWRQMNASDRGRLIWRIAELIEENGDELATLEALDNGKPFEVARAVDIPLAADALRFMAGWPSKIEGTTVPISALPAPGEYLAYTLREPIGVVGQIIPWNFPLLTAAWKLGPALACACTVVLKPAEQTPLSALRLGELLQEAGLPDGVVNIVTGYGDAGAALAAHPQVAQISFTGSAEVGKLIVKAAAGNLKKVALELCGNSAAVVYGDADPEVAIPGAAHAAFFNQGQSRSAGSRLYVQRQVFDDVVAGVTEAAKRIRLGHGTDRGAEMGPLISSDQMNRVLAHVRSARNDGADVVLGGERASIRGYFVQPTILTNTNPSMNVVREEIFGPVVCAIPFDSPDDIIPIANNTNYGLAAGVFTRDISKAHRTAKRLRAGTVWINTYHVFDAAMPFGGYKESGWGREMGSQVLNNYLETKSVVTAL
jgi:phenylacetaldehyde dehydrogenase